MLIKNNKKWKMESTHFFAGFIAGGLSFVTQEENVKYQFRVHLFGRAVDCIYKTQVQKSIQTKKNYTCFSFCSHVQLNFISILFQPQILPLDTYKMYQSFPGDEMNDSLWHMCTVQVWRKKLMQLAESYFIMVKL
ncbi:unnamed protein product (macronuclear) [Paramecium tetraurelia]|uniref:Uncharacterized protein n=1 Tax=Paramecium tetraurelia TaxID=5888 RepID=A0DDW5_PARTE|nr:uncharacterized protein GSPATT00016073001 [Paramecium tetraurelia]CAK81232.1 unnamed protein product [Paramecium tetraurelia]|eukprot:XP_001448629.1 hypothetical protein (macronuclear) [Paramecium tetraurelia strain d4-2]